MAYQDNTNALQLHIKINSENLLPVPQKYNAGSLRIPADPSWPKIPQRKLVDDIGDAIEPPCIVTLTGTPRRSRTVVQTPLNQSPKSTITTKDSAYSSFCHQKTTPSMHTLKRPPGYTDPRFKKVTNIKKNQITSTETLQKETNQPNITIYTENIYGKDMEKEVISRNFKMEQTKVNEAEKPHEEEKIESTQTHKKNDKFNANQESLLQQNQSINNSKTNKRNNAIECDNISKNNICMKNTHSSEYISKSMINDANTQENNGQLFFVLDKKLQTHPLNTIHVDTLAVPQEYANQCYNVQVPVHTYQNIPMQVTPTETNNIQQCLNQLEYKNANEISSLTKKKSEQHVHLNKTQNINKSPVDVPEEKSICERGSKLSVQSNLLKENRKNCFKSDTTENSIISKKLQNSNMHWKQQETTDSEYYIPNLNKKNVHNNVLQNLKMKKIACNTSGEETTDSEFIIQQTTEEKEFIDANKFLTEGNRINSNAVHDDIKTSIQSHSQTNSLLKEDNYLQSAQKSNMMIINQNQPMYQDCKTIICKTKGKNKSEQNLFCTKSQCTRKLCRNSEPYITFKQRKASARFSRKARTYFQKNSHSALADSDYTLVWPNCQYSKYKCNKTNIHKFDNHKLKKINPHFNSIPMHERKMSEQIDNVSNFIEQNYLKNDNHVDSCPEMTKSLSNISLHRERCKCETSPRSNPDNVCNTLKGISPKTQELLNKSYWEYYNKLRHKINTSSMEQQYPYHLTIDALEKRNKKKANEELRSQLKVNPELQTLEQCTALSTMINKALDSNLQPDFVQTKQLYMNDNMKSLSNHKIGMRNNSPKKMPILTNTEHTLNKIRYTKDKTNDKQFLELKSIIFFGGMMYILIIFLPMLYNYFYYEEYDDYENLTYLELIVEYILSSFKEAFGGIFNGIKQVFFYPHACKKCTNIT
ncbi:unnamed protein product [Xylocopa violacea]